MTTEILCDIRDGIATITLNRPDKRNALNTAVLKGLVCYLDDVESRRDVRVVVVRGEGKAFCSGMDLNELSAQQTGEADPESGVVQAMARLERSRHPTIAVVQGDAFAGGCVLATHCDLRVASEVARFCMPLPRLGLIVPFPFGRKLVELIGPAHARQMLFTGAPVPARRAYDIGLVHEVVPLGDLDKAARELARSIADNAPLSLAGMKQTLLRMLDGASAVDHSDLDALAAAARKSGDAREGVRAMLEKRRPAFRGE